MAEMAEPAWLTWPFQTSRYTPVPHPHLLPPHSSSSLVYTHGVSSSRILRPVTRVEWGAGSTFKTTWYFSPSMRTTCLGSSTATRHYLPVTYTIRSHLMMSSSSSLTPSKQAPHDLDRERSRASFPVREMTHVLNGGKQVTDKLERFWNILVSDPLFSNRSKTDIFLSRADLHELALRRSIRVLQLAKEHGLSEEDMHVLFHCADIETPVSPFPPPSPLLDV